MKSVLYLLILVGQMSVVIFASIFRCVNEIAEIRNGDNLKKTMTIISQASGRLNSTECCKEGHKQI